ncbi:MAG: acetyl-CoA carboxylase biotin carboxylase subunit [Candidatus Krumholzibacteria bacterium]|jgi:acetyl-CoA carboxylase biotin carboxylase subunit|nr:acetyl-CoA carboxylase biotin carboxylase subunit [Candidatus Krumholzibacteria bacterium]
MYKKILIASRGEIALRIIRACRELDIRAVAVHSEADADSLHVKLADEDVCIGGPQPSDSYLNIPRIISAAEITGADAIHPAYGFLSENPHFAEVCMSCNIGWIGPAPDIMQKMGDKAVARKLMSEAGLPVVPGSDGVVENEESALKLAEETGYPIMIKAVAGGGGRGIRIIRNGDELKELFFAAGREAQTAFGDGGLYIEKFLKNPRHIEVQMFGDGNGKVVHLGERECSIQRRHQKLLEESPSPGISPSTRDRIFEYALAGARYIRYGSLGTMEFLVTPEEEIYFLEMNTRVQVEHPVTEMVTGFDLIKEQIRLASTGVSPLLDTVFSPRGHAIECRINAEDPDRNFKPTPGTITFYHPPGGPGVRVDSHLYDGYTVPPYYDSLLAKVITWGEDREEARRRMIRSLEECVIEGIPTTIPFQLWILRNASFIRGDFDTSFIDRIQQ